MRVLHIITGLGRGGAETLLYQFCKYDKESEHIVVSLSGSQDYEKKLKQIDIQVHTLNFSNSKINFLGLIKLYKLIRQVKPDIIQTWMIHADMIGGLLARFAGIKNIFWGVHHTNLIEGSSKKMTMLIIKINSILSYFIPRKIIYCAKNSKEVQESIGFQSSKGVVINNGYNIDTFSNSSFLNNKFLNEFNFPVDTFVIGHVGSYSPLKDQISLIEAFSILKQKQFNFEVVLVGTNLDNNNHDLVSLLDKKDLNNHVHLLGRRDDIPTIMNGIDIFVLSSISEAFPNVLNEAMACATPCVTTDVGDAAIIVGNTGWVVPKKNPSALMESILEAVDEKKFHNIAWLQRKDACRKRIVENFSLEEMIKKYKKVWLSND